MVEIRFLLLVVRLLACVIYLYAGRYIDIYAIEMNSHVICLGLAVLVVCMLPACSGEVHGVLQPRTFSEADVAAGRQLIAGYGCGSCHTIPGIPGADAQAAPSLKDFGRRSYIAGRLPNTFENLLNWIQNPQAIKPGDAMPNMGISQDEARDIAAYLYHEPDLNDLLNR